MKIKLSFFNVQDFVHRFYPDDTKFHLFFEQVIKNSPNDIYWYQDGKLPACYNEQIILVNELGEISNSYLLCTICGE